MLLLVGMSTTGGAVTYEFEPGFYGAVSQLLPPGAALTAVRNVQYFDWAATLAPLAVLGAWAAGGLALGLLGERFGPHVRAGARASPLRQALQRPLVPAPEHRAGQRGAPPLDQRDASHSKRKEMRVPPAGASSRR